MNVKGHLPTGVTGTDTVVCTLCGTAWDEPIRMGACPGRLSTGCHLVPEPPGAHHFGPDGMCHWCGQADRG